MLTFSSGQIKILNFSGGSVQVSQDSVYFTLIWAKYVKLKLFLSYTLKHLKKYVTEMKEQTNHENARTLSRFPSDKLCSGKKWDSNEERAARHLLLWQELKGG